MSTKLKNQLLAKLERQKAAVKETTDQLDWIEQAEKGAAAPKATPRA